MDDEDKQPAPEESRSALVKQWVEDIKSAKEHFSKRFEQMRKDIKFAAGKQWPDGTDSQYVANLTLRHLKQSVSSMYAKNPKATYRRRDTLDYTLWDGDPQSLATHMQAAAAGDPNAVALLMELEQVKQKRAMLDRLGKTMVILFNYYLNEPIPPFKTSAKQMLRRVKTCGVGYVKLGYQRSMGKSPDTARRLADVAQRIDHLDNLAQKVADGDVFDGEAQMEELRLSMAALQAEPELILREGLVFDFPASTAVIPDPDCYSIKGWLGARWVAQEYLFTADQIQETYGYDVKAGGGTTYNYPYLKAGGRKHRTRESKYCVYEVYDRATGTQFTVADGAMDYLEEPAPPKIRVEQFIPIYGLIFNELDDDDDDSGQALFPMSDVSLARPMQLEHNRSREGLRQHRIANRPGYVTPKGVFPEEDKMRLATHAESEIIELNITPQTPVEQVLKAKPTAPIDPSVYDTMPFFDDMQRVLGSQSANFAQVTGGSATEVSVAEGARMNDITSDIDELDDFLSLIARESGGIMLREISPETAKKIAGPGAVWPELTGTEISEELFLEIRAGSSGRPNKAQELANMERVAPYAIQSPNLNPTWWLKQILLRMDETVEIEDAIIEGLPSITALNGMAPRGNGGDAPTGNPDSDPNQQGGQGAQNARNPQQNEAGPQPGYPTTQPGG